MGSADDAFVLAALAVLVEVGAGEVLLPLLELGPGASVHATSSSGRQAATSNRRRVGVRVITTTLAFATDLAPPESI